MPAYTPWKYTEGMDLMADDGVTLITGLHKPWALRCQKVVRKVPATYVDVMIVLETTYCKRGRGLLMQEKGGGGITHKFGKVG